MAIYLLIMNYFFLLTSIQPGNILKMFLNFLVLEFFTNWAVFALQNEWHLDLLAFRNSIIYIYIYQALTNFTRWPYYAPKKPPMWCHKFLKERGTGWTKRKTHFKFFRPCYIKRKKGKFTIFHRDFTNLAWVPPV